MQSTTYDAWIGRDAYDPDGEKIGTISDIYYDDVTQRPEWVAVKTGLFGTKETFVPIHGSGLHGDGDLQVAYDKAMVKDAPRIDPEGHLSAEDERELWAYYGYDYTKATTKDYGYGKAYGQPRADRDFDRRDDRDDPLRGGVAGQQGAPGERQGPSSQVRRHRASAGHGAGAA